MEELTGWPVAENDAYICDKLNPMPERFKKFLPKGVKWCHIDAEETSGDWETKIEYECPHCGHIFWVEMPD